MIVQGNSVDNVPGVDASLVSSYNDRIRPLLDAIDKLRDLNVMQEGIQLPTIVVVGDQSSGKSSVLESLAGISLPRGDGICTRVPLVIRLQNHAQSDSSLQLEYLTKVVPTDESNVAKAINIATDEIAGNGKGISHTPLTLVVKKNGVPDLTMIDLPGITRVPVHGQPEDIYEQISDIIMEFIKPEESIILNVLSATVDFPTCESIRMSQLVDKTGERTLAVVTKSDKASDGLHEKVMADDVKIGLGYVCVRNRIGDESYEEARMKETKLFQAHPLLKKIDKSMVGVPVLAKKLVQIQANIISKCLPDIVKKINMKLNANVSELDNLPQKVSTVAEAITIFMRIVGLCKDSLKNLLVRGEFDEYPDDKNMHCSARLAELLDKFSEEIKVGSNNISSEKFLIDEFKVLEESKAIALPNFLPHSSFHALLQLKIKAISEMPSSFIAKVWHYVETVVIAVLVHHCEKYPQFQSHMTRAAHSLISMVSVPVLAKRLVQIQANIISKCLPDIVKKINVKLNANVSELSNLPRKLSTVAEAITIFMRIVGFSREYLKKLLVRGEFDEYPDDKSMHCTARLAEMLDKFSEEIKISSDNTSSEKFLIDEIEVLEETKAIALPNFLPRSAFHALLQLKIKAISEMAANFIAKAWDYVETVVIGVVEHHCEKYPQFQSHMTRAAHNLISSVKEKSTERVLEIVEMEKIGGYTCDPKYLAEWKKLMAYSANLNQGNSVINLGNFGNIDVRHLMNYPIGIKSDAFDLKCRMTAYWKIVLKRMVDCIALQLMLSIQRFANGEMEAELVNEVMDTKEGGIERLLIEMPSVAGKRERLNKSISLLKESRIVLAKIMDMTDA